MIRLATQYVRVTGTGRFNKEGEWTTVTVESLRDARSWDKPFNLDSPMRQSASSEFDPSSIVTYSEAFDVDEFINTSHRSRDVSERWTQS